MKKLFHLLILVFCALFARAQASQDMMLANEYFKNGDFDKAAALYEKEYKNNPNEVYSFLFDCYKNMNEYGKMEKLSEKQARRNSEYPPYYADWAYVLKQENKINEAEKKLEMALEIALGKPSLISLTANSLLKYKEKDWAIKLYESAIKQFPETGSYLFDLANLYLIGNDNENAISAFLKVYDQMPQYRNFVQTKFADNIKKQSFADDLESALYSKIQKKPNDDNANDLLIWLYTQNKDYEAAFRLAKALDKRNKEDGFRIYQLAKKAVEEKQYDQAIEMYQYLGSKENDEGFTNMIQSEILKCRKLKLEDGFSYSHEDLKQLEKDYYNFLNVTHYYSNEAILELAKLKSVYLHEPDTAIALVKMVTDNPSASRKERNEAKLDLGDYYAMTGDVWEATLIYSQVDKDEKDGALGEDARFRNARLSYFRGDFEWANGQLKVLKGSTSELVANDALQLSVFIDDNLNLDTTSTPLQLFAEADFMLFQNKFDDAFTLFDSISKNYQNHKLQDDLLFAKAKVSLKQGKTEDATAYLKQLIGCCDQEILSDDAHFLLGNLYKTKLKNNELAMKEYEIVFLKHPDSIYANDARKLYRLLRGDKLDVEQ